MSEALIDEMAAGCIVTRSRLISRVVTGIYDTALRPFGMNSPQFILLVIIAKFGPMTRSALGRFHKQDRSTLSRNLQIMLDNGWIAESTEGKGRSRPIALTSAGLAALEDLEPAWRASQARSAKLLGAAAVREMFAVGDDLLDRSGLG
ncbi:MarR family transcriptional regulator [Sphingobium amiense]|uniref:MarR family transcriptional regulator n=1 Tax=Sphingobium amiense TaxID=135719 RepID=A0A494VX81_9SPHN|nr:MarR family winged helix-turn-helix transcriptional regulator [Sphingobium amiense]BBD97003.1 MarR family transcriptional regulator [Sphingobium amiense]